MSTFGWRRLLLALCAAGLILGGLNRWMLTRIHGATGSAGSPFGVPAVALSFGGGTFEVP